MGLDTRLDAVARAQLPTALPACRGAPACVASLAALWALLACAGSERQLDAAPGAADRPIAAPADGYVSSDACRTCHPREYATWHASYHRTMTQVATAQTVVAPTDGIELRRRGRSYRFSHEGSEIWVETDDDDGAGRRRLALTTGSHHFQVYWTASGEARKLEMLPFTYQIAERRWIPMDHLVLAHPTVVQGAHWNRVCIGCHATGPQPRLDAPGGYDSRVGEFGIACEACHGPAAQHVRVNRDPQRRYRLHLTGEPDLTIVNPADLLRPLDSQVCGQCHSVSRAKDLAEQQLWERAGPRYRPGESLHASRHVAHGDADLSEAGETRFWPDGMVRVNGREYNALLRTPCFRGGKLSCFSCHEMHPPDDDPRPLSEWTDDQLRAGMEGDASCTQCHPRFARREELVAHTFHTSESSGSRCTNCHMPYTAYGLHKATRSHEVQSPSAAETVDVGRPNACNLCHLDRTLAWAADHLERRYGQTQPALDRADRRLASGVRWALQGDAGQRALAAWHMGWAPAREASGTAWMTPYLAQLLVDPYAAVRSIAWRSLRDLPPADGIAYDFTAPRAQREVVRRRVLARWDDGALPPDPTLLVDRRGQLDRKRLRRLLARRDDRFVYLLE